MNVSKTVYQVPKYVLSIQKTPTFSTPLNFDPRLIYKIVYGLEDYYIERGFSSKKKT